MAAWQNQAKLTGEDRLWSIGNYVAFKSCWFQDCNGEEVNLSFGDELLVKKDAEQNVIVLCSMKINALHSVCKLVCVPLTSNGKIEDRFMIVSANEILQQSGNWKKLMPFNNNTPFHVLCDANMEEFQQKWNSKKYNKKSMANYLSLCKQYRSFKDSIQQSAEDRVKKISNCMRKKHESNVNSMKRLNDKVHKYKRKCKSQKLLIDQLMKTLKENQNVTTSNSSRNSDVQMSPIDMEEFDECEEANMEGVSIESVLRKQKN